MNWKLYRGRAQRDKRVPGAPFFPPALSRSNPDLALEAGEERRRREKGRKGEKSEFAYDDVSPELSPWLGFEVLRVACCSATFPSARELLRQGKVQRLVKLEGRNTPLPPSLLPGHKRRPARQFVKYFFFNANNSANATKLVAV
ncbi:hypothetical protein E2C01_028080 [Portunus trituberculatus]|uniref:Uncharacterized protein n=1 Tax=Portunus trituberculatus TaxID=210409 RepID=A0A5B7EKF0_PORTR|nr:hypothetical protein [Portunus trituberculatus]